MINLTNVAQKPWGNSVGVFGVGRICEFYKSVCYVFLCFHSDVSIAMHNYIIIVEKRFFKYF